MCGNYPSYNPSYSNVNYMGGTDSSPFSIPRSNSYTGKVYFQCTSRYMTFFFPDAHSHSSNLRVAEIFLYACP